MDREPHHSPRWNAVMRRCGWRCAYCRCELDVWNGTVDHVVPRARGGGSYGRFNLVAACRPCNQLKAARDVGEFAPGFRPPPLAPAPKVIAEPPRRSREPSPVASPELLDRLRARAAEASQVHGASGAASLNLCGRKRYAYRSEAETRRRGDRVVACCPACSGFHLVRSP